ncbi:MAG: Uma2 family endonuclease, partial [Verrucomicrobiota bacterium]|nr:Uma2 family endonuclease [Verrucomicrobiota bacterium]
PTTHQRMSAKEYRQLPEGPPYFQLIKGELFMSPSPRFWHQQIVGNIFSLIREHLRKHRDIGQVVISPSDVELTSDDIYQPDIYFVAQARVEEVLTEEGAGSAPDLVVEVLSPSTARLDRGPKSEVYGAAGVKEMWMVSARDRKVEIYLLDQGQLKLSRTLGAGESLETPLIPGLKLDVSEVFEP